MTNLQKGFSWESPGILEDLVITARFSCHFHVLFCAAVLSLLVKEVKVDGDGSESGYLFLPNIVISLHNAFPACTSTAIEHFRVLELNLLLCVRIPSLRIKQDGRQTTEILKATTLRVSSCPLVKKQTS